MPEDWAYQHEIASGLVDVASGRAGLVAIGNSYGDGALAPVLLHSTDGRSWRESALPNDSPSALLFEVDAFGDGYVLVGTVAVGPRVETATPAAWYSADGVSWTRATVGVDTTLYPNGIEGIGDFAAIAAGSDGLIGWRGNRAIAVGAPRTSIAWQSLDGRTWTPVEEIDGIAGETALGGPSPYDYVVGDGRRIVALGPRPSLAQDPADWTGLVDGWVSTDGVTWTALELSGPVRDFFEGMWIVPEGVVYAGQESFWFGVATIGP
jgi:hypothetical protein